MGNNDDNAFVIGNMVMQIDVNNADGKEELEMLTVEDLSNNGVFGEKAISTLTKDNIVKDNDTSTGEEYNNDTKIGDILNSVETLQTSQDNFSTFGCSNSPAQFSTLLSSGENESRTTTAKDYSRDSQCTEIDQFNEVLALRLSRKPSYFHKDNNKRWEQKETAELFRKDKCNEYISERTQSDSAFELQKIKPLDFDKVKLFSSTPPTMNESFSDVEHNFDSSSSTLQDMTIMKEEITDSISESEELVHKEYNILETPVIEKLVNKERIIALQKRRRPVIHRKCKINGKKNIFKSRFISQCLLKYKSNSESNKHQAFANFQCEQCDYSTTNRSNYKNHLLIHGDERLYQCPFCPYKSKQSAGLRAHYKVHSIDKPFACSFCHYKSKRKQNLVQHLKIHAKEKPFRCEECSYQGSTKQLLQNHILWHISQRQTREMKEGEYVKYDCPICTVHFTTEEDLSLHIESHADENTVSSTQEIDTLDKETHRQLERANLAFKCAKCEFITLRKCAFRNHVKSHNRNTQKCDICRFKCDNQSKMATHMESHKIKLFECSYCQFEAEDENDLDSHLEKNHNQMCETLGQTIDDENIEHFKFNCPYCRFTCFMGEILKVHICNHSNNEMKSLYTANDSNVNDSRYLHYPESFENDTHILENECNDLNIFKNSEVVQLNQINSANNNKPSNRTIVPNKRTFNGELIMPASTSINYDGNCAPAVRQSSYASYNNNYELISEASYGDPETKFNPMSKKFKLTQEDEHNHTLNDNSFNCNISCVAANNGANNDNSNMEGINLNFNDNQGQFADNGIYEKTETNHSYVGILNENSPTHFDIPSPNNFHNNHEQDNVINTDSFRMLLHVLENSNFDSRYKSLDHNTMANETKNKFVPNININNESLSNCNVSENESYDIIPTPNFSDRDEVIFQIRDNVSNNLNSQNHLNECQNEMLTNKTETWKQIDINQELLEIPTSEGEYFVNSDLNDFQSVKDIEESVPKDKEQFDVSSKSIINSDIVSRKEKQNEHNQINFSYEADKKRLSISNSIGGFGEKFEKYALEEQNKLNKMEDISECIINQSMESIEIPLNCTIEDSKRIIEGSKDKETENYNCDSCDASFIKKNSLSVHKRSHNRKIYHCSSCSYKTKYKKSLINHRKIHVTPDDFFRCVQCDFSTKRKCSLISHYRSHTQVYICSHCGFQCRFIRELEAHSIEHNEVMSIKCMFCNFTTNKHKMLRYHWKKHTNNPSFKCTRCGFGFGTEDEFKGHIDAHNVLDKERDV